MRAIRYLFLTVLFAAVLCIGAFAADSTTGTTASVQNIVDNASVIIIDGNETATVSYTGLDTNEEYLLLMVHKYSDDEELSITESTILYIDQQNSGSSGTVTFTVYPSAMQDSYLLLIGTGRTTLSESEIAEIVMSYLLGDVDGNGSVKIGDVVRLLQYLVDSESVTSKLDAAQTVAADVNEDGSVKIGDVTELLNILVEIVA